MKNCCTCKIRKDLLLFSKNQDECKDCNKERRIGKEKISKEYAKKYYLENKYKILEQKKEYALKSKNRIKQYNLDNKDKINKNQLLNAKKRREIDPLFKLSSNIRSLICLYIKKNGYSKKTKTNDIIGCDFETFKAHLEKQFTKGMSWSNYGEWHLDHIYPVSLAKDEQHLIQLNHYTNFQPLWAFDNISKGNRIQEKQLFLI